MYLALSRSSLLLGSVFVVQALTYAIASAQSITPANDGTGTTVTPRGNTININGGQLSRDRANLFHSFQKFGLNPGEIANFLSNPAIKNILGRVEGGDASIINGLIQVSGGNSNLFLMNPAGIVFGSGASLNVPASFTATTANAIGFGNNNWFNALGGNNYAALIGNPNSFAFTKENIGAIANSGNIAVNSGQTISLVGGSVINTGTLSAPGGNITITALQEEKLVRITPNGSLLSLELPLDTKTTINAKTQTIAPASLPQLLTGGTIPDALQVVTSPDGRVQVVGNNGYVGNKGEIAASSSNNGGKVNINSRVLENRGNISASGNTGGNINIQTRNLLDAGQIAANGTGGNGGNIAVNYSGTAIQTASATTQANGQVGGNITFNGSQDTVLTTSGSLQATGETGGKIRIFGGDLRLMAASLNASGSSGGGEILAGGDYQGQTTGAINAQNTFVNHATTLNADALENGNGGKVIVWSDQRTDFYGTVTARGGKDSGNGGFMEVSGKNDLAFNGMADASAAKGKAGQLLLDPKSIIIDSSVSGSSFQLLDPNPNINNYFGYKAAVLSNGNIVVSSRGDSLIAQNAGAVYLFNPTTGAVLGTINGQNSGDYFGSFEIAGLNNGNFVFGNPVASAGGTYRGTVILANGTTGVEINRINGQADYDYFGSFVIAALTNGNFVFGNSYARAGGTRRGTVILANGTTGVEINRINGQADGDWFGFGAIAGLTNGNFVFGNPDASAGGTHRGTVILANGTTGVEINRFNGQADRDNFGNGAIAGLTNGNFVFGNPSASAGGSYRGTVIVANGTTGVEINRFNGEADFDSFGSDQIAGLNNGNFVFGNPYASAGGRSRGTVIVANGTTGVEINRINGQADGDSFGSGQIVGLNNGNFVFGNSGASAGGYRRGTVILANGTTGVEINRFNEQADYLRFGIGQIVGLTNGNFVFGNPQASAGGTNRGTVILANGTTGLEINRINGQADYDYFGHGAIVGLNNGNFVFGNGAIAGLNNYNFVFGNPSADAFGDYRGTVILTNGTTGVEINRINGQTYRHYFGNGGISALNNGNYLIASPSFNSSRGRVDIAISNPSSLTYGYFPSQDITINPNLITSITNMGTAVTLQANNDITINSVVTSNNPTGNGGDLTLQAGRSILVNADITTDNGNLTLIANDTAAAGVVNAFRDPGNAVITVAAGVTLNSGTGNTTIRLSTGAGLTNSMSGDITLGNINAANLLVENNGLNRGAVVISGSVNASNINLTGNEIDLNGGANSVSGSTIQLQPTTAQQNIQIGNLADSGAATLDLTTTDLAALKAGFSQVAIGRADGSGTVTINDPAVFNSPVNIAGSSTLVGSNNNTTWNVTGSNKGNLSSANHSLTFENVGNLIGGSGNDSFKFTDTTASISGNIDGKEGTNSLDYSAYSGDASVTLGTTTPGHATAVGGNILNIQGAAGNSTYNNTLTGENAANNWSITGANSGNINGNVTFENFQNLTGGTLNDTFTLNGGSVAKISGGAGTTPQPTAIATPQSLDPPPQEEATPKPQKQPDFVSEKVILACVSTTDAPLEKSNKSPHAIASAADVRLDKLNKLLSAIADFMNSNGGSLSISVDDLLANGGKEGSGLSNNQDLMRQNILARVSASIGAEFTSLVKVRFANVGGKNMAIVEVSKALKPALVKCD
ncbi:filamentous hemagglutinin N-terminal domain-containing protein [Microcoleus sp. FACHB-831]|uniref:beta strand repeat-containing protein n=1 Tax=Microcoleus sp. FACHB-831 TaxID=2692827 RepID=UPI0016857C62|nr:filamentous hemagglutinin N-terminal domain-containing protein [Microcoleus sp. FACHB-831]MBD1920513.1 filamentous hemagglutinin N-terminal domain-containing protein [Microcoleus sp. FACHB-831]